MRDRTSEQAAPPGGGRPGPLGQRLLLRLAEIAQDAAEALRRFAARRLVRRRSVDGRRRR